jgi:thiamine pyrophosphokinase
MKAVVVADGELDPGDLRELQNAALVVAADGGAQRLAASGARPHVVVGDLDSCSTTLVAELEAAGVMIERHPGDKDASDAELAVEHAVAAGADEIVLLGALGGMRLDHEVANLLLVADPAWRPRNLRLVRGATSVRVLHGGERLTLAGALGEVVSLAAIGGDAIGVRTSGLRWALDGEVLPFGRSRGLSNRIVGLPATVELQTGVVLVTQIADSEGGS